MNRHQKYIKYEHFTKKDIQMANKHMKRYSTLLATREMQIKIIRYHYTPIRVAKIMTTPNASWDTEKVDDSYIAAENVK